MKNKSSKESSSNELDKEAENLGIGGIHIPEKSKASYRAKMQRRKEVQSKRVAARNKEKGLILVFTGDGKGKTTAALGIALRTLGHNENIAIVQFIKGGWEPGEINSLKSFGKAVNFHAYGEGFTWETQDREKDQYLVMKSWEKSKEYLSDPSTKLVILDEINIAIKLGYLQLDEVLDQLSKRPPLNHVVLTGRGASESLIEFADLVTEMKLIHHPFREQGIKAQQGIEY